VPTGVFRCDATLRQVAPDAALPGELLVDIHGLHFFVGWPEALSSDSLADDGKLGDGVATHLQSQAVLYAYPQIVSWKIDRSGDGGGVLDLNVGEPQRVVFEVGQSDDVIAITTAMLGFIEALVEAQRAEAWNAANRGRIMDWLGGHMAPDSPSRQVVVSPLHPVC
jgi:hypothetical protein